MNTSAIVAALTAAANSIIDGGNDIWTGATCLRTVLAEDLGTDQDMELLYFQLKDTDGALFWIDESGLDELSDSDMQDYLV